jgi:hypothetical protein
MQTGCGPLILTCVALLLSPAGGATDLTPLPRKKLIMSGWDQPDAAQFRRDLAAFEKYPFDGVILTVPGTKPDGTSFTSYNNLFSPEPWTEAMFAGALADLKAARSTKVTDNFLILWSLPHTVDWFDDAGWAIIEDKFRLMARVAKQGGLRGILFDPEQYSEEHKPWGYLSQPGRRQHNFAAHFAKVRQRGQETMRAMAGEFPDLTLFGYWLFSVNLRSLEAGGNLVSLEADDHGLQAAFTDGWLEAAPATVKFVDGQEFAYRWDGESAFQNGALRVRNDCQAFVTPANRAKYRAQVQASFGFYLDAYVNPPGSSYYLGREGEPRVQRLEANLEAAVRAADEYVWIYGEKNRWWPPRMAGGKPTTNWTEALPGIELALLRAKDPTEAARRLFASATATNLLLNGDFGEVTDGKPVKWWVWQDEKQTTGTFAHDPALGAARLTRMFNGCFGQNLKVQTGERYAVSVKARQTGQGVVTLRVGWKNAAGKWTRGDAGMRLTLADASPGEWRELVGSVRVPEGVSDLALQLSASGQTDESDAAWFDEVRLAKFAP